MHKSTTMVIIFKLSKSNSIIDKKYLNRNTQRKNIEKKTKV